MSSEENEDVSSIVQSFVESELASLDKAATHTDSLELNSKYAQPVSSTKPSALTGPPRTGAKTGVPLASKPSVTSQSSKQSRTGTEPSPSIGGKRTASSSTSSVDTNDQRRTSLGDKFKIFGRRMASNSK